MLLLLCFRSQARALTSLPRLLHPLGNTALDGLLVSDNLEIPTGGSRATSVHSALQGVALPAENIVAYRGVSAWGR